MNAYIKPVAFITEFSPDTAIASADCNTTYHYSETTIAEQTVTCIIHSEEKVFGSTNCQYDAASTGTVVTYTDGNIYFVWYTDPSTQSGDPPSSSLVNKLNAICAYAGVRVYSSDGNGDYAGYHAGLVDPGSVLVTDYYINSY